MNTKTSFRAIVETILERYRQTSLVGRWKEATLSEPEPKPLAFWIRESNDLVNIVWLTQHDIRDISWFPQIKMSTFNLLRLDAFTGLEVREAADAAKQFALPVAGNYIVDVRANSPRGGLIWAASNDKEVAELREFLGQLLKFVSEG